jgi:hypothetical protein
MGSRRNSREPDRLQLCGKEWRRPRGGTAIGARPLYACRRSKEKTMADGATIAPQQLIFASRVNGTPVINADGEHIGQIEDVAIAKRTGQVAYAVLSFGGFLGIGEKYHPLPWQLLTYDPASNAYVISLTKDQLKAAPAYDKQALADIGDTDEGYRDSIYGYYRNYGIAAYW